MTIPMNWRPGRTAALVSRAANRRAGGVEGGPESSGREDKEASEREIGAKRSSEEDSVGASDSTLRSSPKADQHKYRTS